jgi:hypothetical protein
MNRLILSKELLDEEIPKIKNQFSWARKNMLECEPNTPQHQKWFDLMVHLGLEIVEMQERAKNAPSELRD